MLSIAGRAPRQATRTNFYLPLLSLYARWVFRLSPSKKKTPRTVQITYLSARFSRRVHNLNLALGATIGGASLRGQLQPKRYAFLEEVEGLCLPGVDISLIGSEDQKFGHCAETYPLSLLFL